MPFTMTHLHTAKNIYRMCPENISDLSQFYLGTIAPDAVHNRENYISDYKKASHLLVGDEPWGMITNNDGWIENAVGFFDTHKNDENFDFIFGYCSHILTDAYNSINVWMPFKQKYHDEASKGYGGLYHLESNKIDIEIALNDRNKEDFWVYLEKSKSIDFNNIVFADEIDKQKENILNHWYKNKERQDLSSNKVVTIESTMKFIDEATVFVLSKLLPAIKMT